MRHVEHVMGTAVSIELTDPLPRPTLVGLIDQTVAWLHEVDRRFSTYKADSEISRLDRGELTVADCSPDVREVLAMCAELWRESDGYFDAYATGKLDPSGFVKGWSVEVASRWLAANGSTNHCLNAGGDIRARGCPAPGRDWRIGVRHPWQPDKISWVVTGTDVAVATSGVYERGEHVVDPVRGRPATELRSVTVVGADLGRADAYATIAMAMGRPGLEWLARLDAHGYASAAVTEDGRAYTSRRLPTAVAA
ncbi:FAD:protein FMN transferase [Pilimelia anulata]|uniref:FAD:protein FMN transferase n=1 Tax=Pilimelia anulata TaxID=53371 RepID=A0A8J3B7C7_9ACTN|nr:FAD:protein FMN transferase [Pilimelia anulata]GGJ77926.1 FAD:protein FMN transferase [Pilimelia anulata]